MTQQHESAYDPRDPYAGAYETTEGTVYTVTGEDWDEVTAGLGESGEERLVVNMGPQHPSTHGVLRLILTLEAETVTEARVGLGYLHTGIEKNCEYRTWTQGVTFVTRADYLAPLFNEAAYCMALERLLGVEDAVPERAKIIRVLMMELNRISSHFVWMGTTGMEVGAINLMMYGFRERELVLDIFEMITGLRMNHGYIRPGGVSQDLPPGAVDKIRKVLPLLRDRGIRDYEKILDENPIWVSRTKGVNYLDLTGCTALGVTGPILRSTGLPWDLRKSQPYSGYENYDFDVVTRTGADAYDRYRIRLEEIRESCKIIEQCLDRLEPGPTMIEDKKIAWPAQLSLGADGLGNSPEHIKHIMGTSMEALIHHFKLVTEGFRVPPGQAYASVESPRGELAVHLVSDGGPKPYRVHMRDPSFANLQALPAMVEGGMVSDVIVAVASVDPLIGGADR